MRVIRSGRFIRPAESEAARRYLEKNLVSIHGRASRLGAVAGIVHSPSDAIDVDEDATLRIAQRVAPDSSDWLIARDYEIESRQRSIVFLLNADGVPQLVVKLRRFSAPGKSLRQEADVLRAVSGGLDERLRRTIPRVDALEEADGHELLALSAVPGRPLSILMQRSLRPRTGHADELAAAGEWLGALHAATRHGDRTAVHGDFWPRNVLFVTRSAVAGVIDWEDGAASGSPWGDLFTLPILFATAAPAWRTRDPLVEFGRAFARDTRLAAIIRTYFRSYQRRASIDAATLRACFEEFLETRIRAGKEETGWQARYPWPAMLELLRTSRHSVFSG